ncbi:MULTISPECIES: MFS transporter [Burkholderiaceae]|uniref:Putative sugar transport protein n=1 Tax=Caballeronia sordidicola TaxID=196367 RepID=A0A242MAI7_CABSO|nr:MULTISPECIES: MFS transporter [Burkholderiaceae]OTP67714.1 putative sugar transport protein [Caballeronia sordidicola]
MSQVSDAGTTGKIGGIGHQRKVIIGATVGTIFEWYDFFLYISVASVIATKFFSNNNPASAEIFALLTFATGYLVRPFGALFFGRLGDLVGRKHTFLATILIMGCSTIAIGLLPTYATVGILAPSLLTGMRMLQGLALGGEYGGAATYIAEHAPAGQRGASTAWLQISATLGFALSVLVVLGTRTLLTEEQYAIWGWRVLFLISIVPLAISVWIRLKLEESPMFLEMKRQGTLSKAPIRETLGQWPNARRILIAMFGMVAPQSVLLVGAQIYSLVFLVNTIKVDVQIANFVILTALMLGLPSFIWSGKLSDRLGTKPFIVGACLLGALTYLPLYKALTFYANPALYVAQQTVPVLVVADPAECSLQFNPIGRSKRTSGCDIVKDALVRTGAPYSNRAAAPGSVAIVYVGGQVIALAVPGKQSDARAFGERLTRALTRAGYPAHADKSAMNYPMIILILACLSSIAGMIFGPLASAMTSFFPARIRYTSVSFSYHVGNGLFGGLMPAISAAIQISTGNIYGGVWYTVAVVGVTFFVALLFLPSQHSLAKEALVSRI